MNRAISALAFVCLAVFFGVLMWKVKRFDLSAVIVITLGLAAYDLWLTLYRPRWRR